MESVAGLECLRCGTLYPPEHYSEDCPRCRTQAPSNLAVAYRPALRRPRAKRANGDGLWRYGDVLPVGRADAVSLGEGGSPLHRLEPTGRALKLDHLFA